MERVLRLQVGATTRPRLLPPSTGCSVRNCGVFEHGIAILPGLREESRKETRPGTDLDATALYSQCPGPNRASGGQKPGCCNVSSKSGTLSPPLILVGPVATIRFMLELPIAVGRRYVGCHTDAKLPSAGCTEGRGHPFGAASRYQLRSLDARSASGELTVPWEGRVAASKVVEMLFALLPPVTYEPRRRTLEVRPSGVGLPTG